MRQGTRKGLMTVAAATGVIAAASGHAHADSGASGSSANSPGVLSGNTVQAPVHVPVNVCGNTISVVGILNPAIGNSCADQGGGKETPGGYGDEHGGSGDHGSSGGGAQADGHTEGSPGVGSGNHVQAPIHVPVNVCGNSVSVIGVGNAAVGGDCADDGGTGHGHTTPPGGGDGGTTPPGTPDNPGGPGNPEQPGTPGDGGTGPDRGVDSSSGTRDVVGSGTGDDTASRDGDRAGDAAVTQLGRDSQLAQTGSGLPMGAAASLSAGALLAGAVLYRRARASA
ncbi:chaplin [Streptomyces sp. NPDC059861]|uniref:chaplin n=1 Tax=Streptomyces sp. NPDC059861 TaxID=3346974 RepID=UPI003658E756